ncbi:hypothetical protein U1Q18_014256, partial [Sarracenia purpurea var. burkii]
NFSNIHAVVVPSPPAIFKLLAAKDQPLSPARFTHKPQQTNAPLVHEPQRTTPSLPLASVALILRRQLAARRRRPLRLSPLTAITSRDVAHRHLAANVVS